MKLTPNNNEQWKNEYIKVGQIQYLLKANMSEIDNYGSGVDYLSE